MKLSLAFGGAAAAAVFAASLLSMGGPARSQTTAEMMGAEAARIEKADRRLNAAYKKLLALEDATAQAKLRKAQRAWIAFRDAEAQYAADANRGGSAAGLQYAAAIANLTERRAADMERMLRQRRER